MKNYNDKWVVIINRYGVNPDQSEHPFKTKKDALEFARTERKNLYKKLRGSKYGYTKKDPAYEKMFIIDHREFGLQFTALVDRRKNITVAAKAASHG